MRRPGPHDVHSKGACIGYFEAQSHGFGTRCLRFAVRVTHTPRKTRFRPLAKFYRTGLITRRVPTKGFRVVLDYISSSFPKFRDARTVTYFWEIRRAYFSGDIKLILVEFG